MKEALIYEPISSEKTPQKKPPTLYVWEDNFYNSISTAFFCFMDSFKSRIL